MKRFEIFFGIIKAPLDFLMTVLAFLAAFQLRIFTEKLPGFAKPIDYSVLPTDQEYLKFSLATALALVIIFGLNRLYSLKATSSFSKETGKVFIGWLIWAMLMISYFFFTRSFPFSRLATLYSWALTGIFIVFGRLIIRVIQNIFLKNGIGRRRLLFIGHNKITAEIYKALGKNPSYKIVGVIGEKDKSLDLPLLGNMSQFDYIIKKQKIDEIIQTSSLQNRKEDEDILEFCDLNHINYRFVPDMLEVRRTNVLVETVGDIPIIALKPTPLDGWGKVYKRIFDIIGSIVAMIVLSPVFLITAIAIKIDSKGPIIFSKLDDGRPVKRVGQQEKLFKFYKFRSMYPQTDNLRYTELADKNIRTDGPLVKIKDDPRITRVGRFIRKYSIDELPQLWNVLVGNMSLVGPRAHLPEEVAKYKKHHYFAFVIKPGITGLAQINGRSDLEFEKEARLDHYYIENWSPLLDLKIILKTIKIVFKGYKE